MVCGYQNDRFLFEKFRKKRDRYQQKLGDQLRESGLYALWTFDHPDIRDHVSTSKAININTKKVPGIIGSARQFDGLRDNSILTTRSWMRVPGSYSITTWVNLPPDPDSQTILFWTGGIQKTGVMLENGDLVFAVPDKRVRQILKYPFSSYNTFTHIAAVYDQETGQASLFENGILMTNRMFTAYEQPSRRIEFGKQTDFRVRQAFYGIIDETAIWSRALTPEEIHRIAKRNVSILKTKSPLTQAKYRITSLLETVTRKIPLYLDYFNPALQSSFGWHKPDTTINLLLSNDDKKFLNQQWNSFLYHQRTDSQSFNGRTVQVAMNDKLLPAEISLYFQPPVFDNQPRASYLLEFAAPPPPPLDRQLLILAPEQHDFLLPALTAKMTGLDDQEFWATLQFNGSEKGFYYCGNYRELANMRHINGQTFEGLSKTAPFDRQVTLDAYQDLVNKFKNLLRHDRYNGMSARETVYHLETMEKNMASWNFSPPSPPSPETGPAPSSRSLPQMSLYIEECTRPNRRTPCLVTIENSSFAHEDKRGTIKRRGNASLQFPKKSFSIRFEEPHRYFDESETLHAYLQGNWRDLTHFKNKLAFDLYHGMASPHYASSVPRSMFVECYSNTKYLGIFLLQQRVDPHLLDWQDPPDPEEPKGAIYKSLGPGATFKKARTSQYRQTFPRTLSTQSWEPFENLMNFIGRSPTETFREQFHTWLDIDQIAELELLLQLSNDPDGFRTNLYFAKPQGPSQQFLILPWDKDRGFDKTYDLSNHLFRRLHKEMPGYSNLRNSKWAAYRQSVLSETNVMDLISDYEAVLRDAVHRDAERWNYSFDRWTKATQELRSWVLKRLQVLDERYKHPAPEGPSPEKQPPPSTETLQ